MSAVHHLTPMWSEKIGSDPREEPLCVVSRNKNSMTTVLRLPASGGRSVMVSFPCRVGAPDADFDEAGRCVAIRAWGLRQLGPGVWAVAPSIVEPRYNLHAFVVLCDVPDGAISGEVRDE